MSGLTPGSAGGGPREADPLALERQVCSGLVVAARSVPGVHRPVLERLGPTHPQHLVVLALRGREPLSVTGLVERRRLPEDQRTLAVSLTADGRRLRTRAERATGQVLGQLGRRRGAGGAARRPHPGRRRLRHDRPGHDGG